MPRVRWASSTGWTWHQDGGTLIRGGRHNNTKTVAALLGGEGWDVLPPYAFEGPQGSGPREPTTRSGMPTDRSGWAFPGASVGSTATSGCTCRAVRRARSAGAAQRRPRSHPQSRRQLVGRSRGWVSVAPSTSTVMAHGSSTIRSTRPLTTTSRVHRWTCVSARTTRSGRSSRAASEGACRGTTTWCAARRRRGRSSGSTRYCRTRGRARSISWSMTRARSSCC